MSDWFKKITAFITSSEESAVTPYESKTQINKAILKKLEDMPVSLFHDSSPSRRDPSFTQRQPSSKLSKSLPVAPRAEEGIAMSPSKEKEKIVTNETHDDDNIKALKRLRDLPRGTQVDSRIAAIQSLLGQGEIFKTLKMLRWPQGVICPRCHSSNVVRRDPPPDVEDQRHFYICLNCKGDGGVSDFDDFTGLPIGSIHALRQWMLCWYLIGFCSVAQIAKVLGLSAQEVMQIATLGSELTELPDEAATLSAKEELKDRKTQESRRQRARIDEQEENTRSASKSPLKPGYKSKK